MHPDPALYVGLDLNDRYEVKNFISSGGFCLVFEAYDRKEDRRVALKILSPGARTDGRIEFESEKDILARFHDASNVVTCLGADDDSIDVRVQNTGTTFSLPINYLVLELADACLVDLLANRNQVSWEERLDLFRGLVRGIHQMHQVLAVHRDVKCDNVLVYLERGGVVTAKVADLGRSKCVAEPSRFSPDEYALGRGDLRFAPPEFLWRLGIDDPDAWRRGDLYLIGSAFFEIATGQGITPLLVGNPFLTLKATRKLDPAGREQDFRNEIGNLRAQMEHPLSVLAQELPSIIRYEGVRFVRQLCDPDPPKRESRFSRRDVSDAWSLEWILRRVDIMRRQLRYKNTRGAK